MLLPHSLFNRYCPAGHGYLCFPCFVQKVFLDVSIEQLYHRSPSFRAEFAELSRRIVRGEFNDKTEDAHVATDRNSS
ncbi:MAG: hypothetical protein IT195_12535 [Microthrixaceae bacterium]|nr:hypothetical protein [Microthrixaceae bacterium]